MSEFALIRRHFSRPARDRSVRLGVGDDAAIVVPTAGCELAMAVDMLVEGRHFAPGVDAATLGHKTLAVNLSDMAAMGATPRWALLAGALPAHDDAWLAEFTRGFFALADRHAVDLIGGDTTRGPRNLCLTIVGEIPAGMAITRGGAQVGDDVYVSGSLGDASLALAVAMGETTVAADLLPALQSRLDSPEPRVALGLQLRGLATAALDISDGLLGDLAHILDASGVAAAIELATIPCSAELRTRLASPDRTLAVRCVLAGGDDYELCFTAAEAQRARIEAMALELALPLTRIGVITDGSGLRVVDIDGEPLAVLPRAFDHFP